MRKTGDGLIDGTWTDAWSYYVASQYRVSDNNRLELYAVGAPQRHGQNLYKLNLATLNREFAAGLTDYDPRALERFSTEAGRYWSPNVGGVNPAYTGRQFNSTGPGAGVSSRHARDFINERENYFHKPQVNLNWYSYFGNGLTMNTVAYYSGAATAAARAPTARSAGTTPTASASPTGTPRSSATGATTTAGRRASCATR